MTQDIPTAAEPIDQVQELMRLADALSIERTSRMVGLGSVARIGAARAALETAIRAALAHPAATAVSPLTDEQIGEIQKQLSRGRYGCTYRSLARAIEVAHGIGASPAASTAGAPIPPSRGSKSDTQIAEELQLNMDRLLEPEDADDKIKYRTLIRIMARARNRLEQIAASTAGATPETPETLGDAASRPGLSAGAPIPIAHCDGRII